MERRNYGGKTFWQIENFVVQIMKSGNRHADTPIPHFWDQVGVNHLLSPPPPHHPRLCVVL